MIRLTIIINIRLFAKYIWQTELVIQAGGLYNYKIEGKLLYSILQCVYTFTSKILNYKKVNNQLYNTIHHTHTSSIFYSQIQILRKLQLWGNGINDCHFQRKLESMHFPEIICSANKNKQLILKCSIGKRDRKG